MKLDEAIDKANRMALKWGGTWAVCWEPTQDGEGRYFVSGAGIYPSKELERAYDPLPPNYLASLWEKIDAIRRG